MAVDLSNLSKLIKVEHTVEPTWAKDAGRNSNSGKFSGTFVGYFDTLKVNVGKTNQAELTAIKDDIEHPIISVIFKDSKTGNNKTELFYGTAITAAYDNLKGRYDPFSFSLKAIESRDDME